MQSFTCALVDNFIGARIAYEFGLVVDVIKLCAVIGGRAVNFLSFFFLMVVKMESGRFPVDLYEFRLVLVFSGYCM